MSAGVRVGVIGMGNVGPAIASSLRAAGARIVGVSARSAAARDRADAMLPGVPLLTEDEVGRQAEILFLAVPDGQIQAVTEHLVASGGIRPGMVVAHLSGAVGLDPLAAASAIGAIPLALHPAMTFSGTSLDVRRLQGCPIAYTSSELARPVALALIEYLGGVPLRLDEADRPRYHAGLAHAANHLVTLLVQAQDVLESAGVDGPGEAMRPLVEAAVERALTEGIDGLTGPVVRGDDATVNAHIASLEADPELRDVARTYRSLVQATRVALKGDSAEPLVLHTREQLRRALEDDPRPTSLVMTMGALHAGHLSLVKLVARSGHKVVVTIFVNPEQFGEGEDFDSYPRTLEEDVAALAEVGVDIVYAPPVSEVYPHPSRIHITPGPASTTLEGALRPGHFAGVLQVVGKMMNLIRPRVAVFGQKDAQQFVNIRQMVEDLDLPLELVQAPIVRDEDGLALSSRNAYLSDQEKVQALALNRALELGREVLDGGGSGEEAVTKIADHLAASPGVEAQYVALAAADSFEVAALWTGGSSSLGVENLTVLQPGSEAYLLVAAQVGPARLIDNVTVRVKADD
ncbi:pantoate--beta-alanine ligase [Actinomyces minihominis]|uniref:pantoate--beta-alanine ligase n=1 Tax=Actinomyces minihominis TaxID=2002838 RepID=UPI001F5D540D|nr:pantoate--beta-alanine ligase [Actinomyces minihominis]